MDHRPDQENQSLHLFVVLSRASQWVGAHALRDVRRYGLGITEFGVLELLYHKGRQPLQQIGTKILMSSGNITYVVDKLVSRGWVRRIPCESDRRVSYAEITDEGCRFLEEAFPQHREALEHAMSGLTTEERQQAIELLKKLGKSAQELYQG